MDCYPPRRWSRWPLWTLHINVYQCIQFPVLLMRVSEDLAHGFLLRSAVRARELERAIKSFQLRDHQSPPVYEYPAHDFPGRLGLPLPYSTILHNSSINGRKVSSGFIYKKYLQVLNNFFKKISRLTAVCLWAFDVQNGPGLCDGITGLQVDFKSSLYKNSTPATDWDKIPDQPVWVA